MLSIWTQHLKDPKEIENFQREVRSAKSVLDRLHVIYSQREKTINTIESGVKQYEVPNWDYRQAHYNGGKSELQWAKTLLNLDQKDTQT